MQVGLLKAIRFFGTQKALAKILGVKQQAISHWLNRQNNIPYPHVIKIVSATKGYITPEELAPNNPLNKSVQDLFQMQGKPEDHTNLFLNQHENSLLNPQQNIIEYRESFEEKFRRKDIQRKLMKRLHIKNYVKISTHYWMEVVDKKMKRLGSDPIIVSFYVQTCPHANVIGIYHLAISQVACDTGITEDRVFTALTYLKELDYCSYDEEKEFIWVHEMAVNQIATHLSVKDKRSRLINDLYHSLPSLSFLDDFYNFYKDRYFLTPRPIVSGCESETDVGEVI